MSASPSTDYAAEPLDNDLFEWHFTLRGPPGSPYAAGLYHGRILLPPTYPLRPPSFRFTTPNGRFEANREICLSISGHHEETWQPAWGIRTAIVALRSFMETDARGQLGGLDTPDDVRRRLAAASHSFRCLACARSNADIIAESELRASQASASSSPVPPVEVPRDLRMGWRDEMEAAKPLPPAHAPETNQAANNTQVGNSNPVSTNTQAAADDDDDDDSLAESFVQTVPAPAIRPPPASHVIAQSLSPARARSTTPRNNSIPLWIDRTIVALVVMLVALLLKIFFGP